MNTKTPHIIWSRDTGLESGDISLELALGEAKKLAEKSPHTTFEIYALVATVTASVKVDVHMEDAGQIAAPLSSDVAPVTDAKIDLRTCVKGQKLRLRNGEIAEYSEPSTSPWHYVLMPNTGRNLNTHSGHWTTENSGLDVIEILPLHYPHLRPVPPELLPLPEGAVYLGRGGEFEASNKFVCWYFGKYLQGGWSDVVQTMDSTGPGYYCAPADSEIVRLNREGAK